MVCWRNALQPIVCSVTRAGGTALWVYRAWSQVHTGLSPDGDYLAVRETQSSGMPSAFCSFFGFMGGSVSQQKTVNLINLDG